VLATDTQLARRVGAFALGVFALAFVFFVFVYPRIDWGSHIRVRVYFHTTGGLVEGAPFVVAGRTVGKVESIALVPRGVTKLLGDEDGIVLTVAVDSGEAAKLDRGGDVFIASKGALSGKYLELGAAPQPTQPLKEGDELVGADPPSLDRVLQRTWDNMQTLAGFAGAIRPELEQLKARLRELSDNLGQVPGVEQFAPLVADASAALDELQKLRDVALGGKAGAARIAALLDHGRAAIGNARVSLDKLSASASKLADGLHTLKGRLGGKGDEAIEKFQLAIDRTRAAIAKIDPLLAQIEALNADLANGSMMKLGNDPEFPEDAKELGKILKRHPWRVMDHP